MTFQADYNDTDFGSANPSQPTGEVTAAAYRVADKLNLYGLDANSFTQGFIHAQQFRNDLVGRGSSAYDAGYACGNCTCISGL